MQTLPPLTHADPALSESDRVSMLDRLERQIRDHAGDQPAELIDELVVIYRDVALRQTDARWWLRHITSDLGRVVREHFSDDDKQRLLALAARREAR